MSAAPRQNQANLDINRALVDPFKVDFDGIFGGGNIQLWCVQNINARIQETVLPLPVGPVTRNMP